MDSKTVQQYTKNAEHYIKTYQQDFIPYRLYELINTFFIKEGKTLDIGCASGRDLNYLCDTGFRVEGLDIVDEFVNHCKQHFPKLHIFKDQLPTLKTIPSTTKYDNILLSAILMHLDNTALLEAIDRVISITSLGGRIIVSMRLIESNLLNSNRDDTGRLFNNISAGQLIHLFNSFGASLLFQETQPDNNRSSIKWDNFVFEKTDPTKKKGIETIQEIIVKDKKDTTYKLALLRSLVQLAKYESSTATYDATKDFVYLPLKRVAFYWLKFYFPLLKQNQTIRQSKSHKHLAFEKQIKDLHYTPNELALLIDEYDSEKNRDKIDPILKKIKHTIHQGPMKYIGNSHYELFPYIPPKDAQCFIQLHEPELGMIGVPVSIWHDMILFGHWIEDSIVIQWAKLSEQFTKDSNFADYLKLLTTPTKDKRTTEDIKKVLHNISIECIYSEKKIKKFDVDHVIPYSVWSNNDLWNMLPATPSLNRQKSDKIPSPDLIRNRKDLIIHYWTIYKQALPDKFNYQALKALGSSPINNWENKMFLSFYETISRLSVMKIADTWDYSSDQ